MLMLWIFLLKYEIAYKTEVILVRKTIIAQQEFLDRLSLAKMLAKLLPSAARVATESALESFRKNPVFKTEMEKPASYATRQRMRMLLPKERKPEASTNWAAMKRFYLKSLASNKPRQNGGQNKNGQASYRGRGGRGNRGNRDGLTHRRRQREPKRPRRLGRPRRPGRPQW